MKHYILLDYQLEFGISEFGKSDALSVSPLPEGKNAQSINFSKFATVGLFTFINIQKCCLYIWVIQVYARGFQ